MEEEKQLEKFVKELVDEFPVGDIIALKIFNFYKDYITKKNDNWRCGKCDQENINNPNAEKIPEHSRHCNKI